MNSWKKINLVVMVFVLLLLGQAIFLISTTSGLHLLFNIAHRWVPELEIDQIYGNWRNLRLSNIRYNRPGLVFNVSEFHLALRLSYLHNIRLQIDDLSLENVDISIDLKKSLKLEKTKRKESSRILSLLISCPITLNRLALSNASIKIDDFDISVTNFTSGVLWQKKKLTIKPTYLQGLLVSKMITMQKATQEKNIKTKNHQLKIEEKFFSKILKDLYLKLSLLKVIAIHLPINFDIEEFQAEKLRITGDTTFTVHRMILKISNTNNNIHLKTLYVDSNKGKMSAVGSIQLHGDWPINVDFNNILSTNLLQGEIAKLKIIGALREKFEVCMNFSGPLDMKLHIRANLAEMELPLDIEMTSKQFSWPFIGKQQYQADNFKFKLTGKITNYILSFYTLISEKGKNTSKAIIILNAHGNKRHINFDKFLISINATIDMLKLNNSLSDLSGTVKGLIKLNGNLETPRLVVNISAKDLHWRNLSISYIRINSDMNFTDQIKGKLSAYIKHITQSDININLMTLKVSGNEKQHKLKLLIYGKPISSQLFLSGNFNRNKKFWKGQINNVLLKTSFGSWILTQPVALNYQIIERKIHIGSQYWKNYQNKKLFVRAKQNKTTETTTMMAATTTDFNCLNLTILESILSSEIQVSGLLIGGINIAFSDAEESNFSQVNATLSLHEIKTIQTVDTTPLPLIELSTLDLKLKVSSNSNQIEFSWLVRLIDDSQLDGKIRIKNFKNLQNFSSNINIHNFNLATINTIFSQKEKIAGILNTNLKVISDNINFQIFGYIQLYNIDISGNFMPLEMKPSQMIINFNGTHSTLKGEIRTERGLINLSGNADWSQINNWKVKITAKGSQIHISLSPISYFDISPDMTFEVTTSTNLFNIHGYISIPWARIKIHEFPKSIADISKDEVILNKNLKPIKLKRSKVQINSNLIFHIGNNVQIDAFGLNAKFTGNLTINQNKEGKLDLNGHINIPGGRFQAYGQDLLVRKGEILFLGPLEESIFNMEAIRNPEITKDNIIVGVNVVGTADKLNIKIFSNPKISQEETLSYLLRGKSLGSSKSNAEDVTSILVGLGVSQSNQAISKIGKIFGINNLAMGTQGIGDSSQIVISGYVLPDLEIQYGLGIFNLLATLTLRYCLLPNLYLEVVSGINQTLDLLYQFEF